MPRVMVKPQTQSLDMWSMLAHLVYWKYEASSSALEIMKISICDAPTSSALPLAQNMNGNIISTGSAIFIQVMHTA